MHRCCIDGAAAPEVVLSTPSGPRPGLLATLIQWALPLTALALIPKCPGCVAVYVLFFTGIGLSLPAATATRWTLIALSIAALVYLVIRTAKRTLAITERSAACTASSRAR